MTGEIPENNFGDDSIQGESHQPEDQQKTETEELRQDTLRFLTESGRAANLVEAEQYLTRLNEIKEKLVTTICDLLRNSDANAISSDGTVSEFPRVYFNGKLATLQDIPKITLDGIDRADAELWRLEKLVRPRRMHLAAEKLNVKFSAAGNELTFVPEPLDEGITDELFKSLTDEQRKFLKREYAFALKDLEGEIRKVADSVATQTDFVHRNWRNSLSG